jgi:hypothetical protein
MNGNLAYYYNMDLPTSFPAPANATVGSALIHGPFTFDSSSLILGTNLVAAEVHVSTNVTAFTYGTELLLNVPSTVLPPGGATNNVTNLNVRLYIARQSTNVVVSWTNTVSGTLRYKKTVGTNPPTTWANVPSQTNPYTNAMGTNVQYYYQLIY